MPAPIFSLATTGTDPKATTAQILEDEVNRVIGVTFDQANPEDRDAAALSAEQAAESEANTAANTALSLAYKNQSQVAAIAAGAPIVTTLTDPVPANDTVEVLQANAGGQVWQVSGGAWGIVGWLTKPEFPSIAAMALASGLINGQGATVRNGANGQSEDFDWTAGSLTADGALVVDGVGGQWVSKRTVYADWAEFYADPRGYGSLSAGQALQWGDHSYTVLPLGASSPHLTRPSGLLLRVNPKFHGFNIEAFGAVADCVLETMTGTDNTDAIRKTFVAAAEYYTQLSKVGATEVAKALVEIPWGQFRVTGDLFADAPQNVGAPPSYVITGTGKGRGYGGGPGGSCLVLSNSSGTMFDNEFKASWFSAHGLQFYGVTGSKFWNGQSGGATQSFDWHDCGFVGFSNIIDAGADTGNSEWSFTSCKFGFFDGTAFKLNNPQSVNWRFIGCDAEVFTGSLFEFLKGATVYWAGGSIIPEGSSAKVVSLPVTADGNSFGRGNSPQLHMVNTRTELRSGAKLFDKAANNITSFGLKFDGCGMGGFNVASGFKTCVWAGGGTVTFTDCYNMDGLRWDYTVNGTGSARMRMNILRSDITDDFIEGSTWTVTGPGDSGRALPKLRIEGCIPSLNGEYEPSSSSPSSGKAEWRAVSFAERGDVLMDGNWDGSTPLVKTIKLPPVVLRGVLISPVVNAAYGGTTMTVKVKDSGGAVLAEKTFTMNASTPPEMFLTRKQLTISDRTLTVEVTTSTGAVFFFARAELALLY